MVLKRQGAGAQRCGPGIGAGHLPGERGVVALLRARGLELKRVR